jgi:hypothetical protein
MEELEGLRFAIATRCDFSLFIDIECSPPPGMSDVASIP